MRRAALLALLLALFFSVFSLCVSAEDGSAEEYIEDFYSLVGEKGAPDSVGIESLLSELLRALGGERTRISAFAAFVLGAVMLIALAAHTPSGSWGAMGASAIAAAGAVGFVFELASSMEAALVEMSELFLAMIPIMTGITLSGGGTSAFATEAMAHGLALGAVSGIMTPLLLPLSVVMLVLSSASALGGGAAREALSRFRAVFLFGLGIVTAIMLGAISLQTVISTARDSAAMRVAKYSASGFIPVIGGAVSASLSSLAAGLSYAKSIVGAGGIYALLLTALSPLLLVLIYRAILSIGSGALSFLGEQSGAASLGAVVYALDALLSVYGISLVLYIFEVVMFMKSGVAIL